MHLSFSQWFQSTWPKFPQVGWFNWARRQDPVGHLDVAIEALNLRAPGHLLPAWKPKVPGPWTFPSMEVLMAKDLGIGEDRAKDLVKWGREWGIHAHHLIRFLLLPQKSQRMFGHLQSR